MMRWYEWLGLYLGALSLAWLFIIGATIKERRLEYHDRHRRREWPG